MIGWLLLLWSRNDSLLPHVSVRDIPTKSSCKQDVAGVLGIQTWGEKRRMVPDETKYSFVVIKRHLPWKSLTSHLTWPWPRTAVSVEVKLPWEDMSEVARTSIKSERSGEIEQEAPVSMTIGINDNWKFPWIWGSKDWQIKQRNEFVVVGTRGDQGPCFDLNVLVVGERRLQRLLVIRVCSCS